MQDCPSNHSKLQRIFQGTFLIPLDSHQISFPSLFFRKRKTKELTESCPSILLPATKVEHFLCWMDSCHLQQLATCCPQCPLSALGALPGEGLWCLKTRVIVTFIIQTRLLSEHGEGAINKLPGTASRAGAAERQIRAWKKCILVNSILSAL